MDDVYIFPGRGDDMRITLDCELTDDGNIIIKKTENVSVEDFNRVFSEGRRIILDETFFDDELEHVPGQMSIYDFL